MRTAAIALLVAVAGILALGGHAPVGVFAGARAQCGAIEAYACGCRLS